MLKGGGGVEKRITTTFVTLLLIYIYISTVEW